MVHAFMVAQCIGRQALDSGQCSIEDRKAVGETFLSPGQHGSWRGEGVDINRHKRVSHTDKSCMQLSEQQICAGSGGTDEFDDRVECVRCVR